MVILFSVAIFVGAALLFLVQPMFARMVLPYLGGSPAVWNTALVFYQAVLMGGYAYAHLATRWLGVRRQVWLHLALLLVPVVVLPLAIPLGWMPETRGNPIPSLLAMMALSVGLPFFVVSATSPLLQRWFASTNHRLAADPYFLYSASNLGSLLALAAYPVLIEPWIGLVDQSRWWGLSYAGLVALVAACGLCVQRSGTVDTTEESTAAPLPGPRRGRWLLLAFVPSSLMMSVTTYMTSEIAPVPLLWVIPLGTYLLTFVLVFARRKLVPHVLTAWMVPIAVLALLWKMIGVLQGMSSGPVDWIILLHLVGLFVVAMMCHGELAKDRPPRSQLTEFYLWISAGGVLGGMFNALLAPRLFPTVLEYPVTLILACALVPRRGSTRASREWIGDIGWPILLAALTVALNRVARPSWGLGFTIASWLPGLLCLVFYRRPVRLALTVAAVFVAAVLPFWTGTNRLCRARSYFGLHQVIKVGEYHYLIHGNTTHGIQCLTPDRRREPLAYFSRSGPLGEIMKAVTPAAQRQVAVVGLGAGTVACYGERGQQWTFYEIDPTVERIARDPRYFTFLDDSLADVTVVLGDARLSLQQAPDGKYGVIILDAYTSDSLPLHLLTREALALYLRKLGPDGVLAFHISTRHLDLKPVLANLAHDAGLSALYMYDFAGADLALGKCSSRWLVMSRLAATVQPLANGGHWRAPRPQDDVGVWTDDYSSLFRAWRW